ncbi:hypothetical protein THERMOT_1400 [Bathymodiolus thermophilus thioautotrophic gill symbiont]|uniref:glucosaminidase domain-containing protein n=1 Tax=Bathymodiolus thermophilus thioautotrophic gill symbiont TaxID=2360 RepID=UPI00192BAAF6|nr:glucosaminidase domain-containing protein [Bathymodiolus thermophilus thioautotrophic gill symbiont]CAB5501314.1 hypothetical protein THERMOT_1400 [Bathymodiolus thermophilus thioautotrophic gill symbiont]
MKNSILLALIAITLVAHITLWPNSPNPPNFKEAKSIQEMKDSFFNYLLPIVKAEEQKIRDTRSSIEKNQLSVLQMKKLAKKYHLKRVSKEKLLNMVDVIPVSLVLAQAAIESNWGRSRFAMELNNYFGIWCFTKNCGVIPKNRDKGAKHRIKRFSSTEKSIEYYLLNINRNRAYKLLREIRAYKRKHNLKITGKSLAEGLDKYSVIGYEYIESVQSIIRQNNLTRFD